MSRIVSGYTLTTERAEKCFNKDERFMDYVKLYESLIK